MAVFMSILSLPPVLMVLTKWGSAKLFKQLGAIEGVL